VLVGVGVGVVVTVFDGVTVTSGVSVGVGVAVGVDVTPVNVGVTVGVAVGVFDGLIVGLGVGVGNIGLKLIEKSNCDAPVVANVTPDKIVVKSNKLKSAPESVTTVEPVVPP